MAEVLTENTPMQRVLHDLGLYVQRSYEGGTVSIRIVPKLTPRLQATIEAREHEAERTSLTRVLAPRSVAVIGAGRGPRSVDHRLVRNLIAAGFAGPIHPVNPRGESNQMHMPSP